jgi:hypothetical protein
MATKLPPDIESPGAMIKGLQSMRIKYGAKLFYAYLVLEYGYNQWVCFKDIKYCSRRNLFRLCKQLREADMICEEYRLHGQKFLKAT